MFRAYFALPQLTNSVGHPTGAIHGFVSAIRYLQKTFHGARVIVTFDTSEPTFRHRIYSEYKSNRSAMPEELQNQIEPIFALVSAMGLPLIRIPGFEADDIIATYAKQATQSNTNVIIVSGDKDLMQLVNENVTMFEAIKRTTIRRDQVFAKFGVWPEQIHDLLCLTGDTVDNIPGVPKVGNKTAAKWLGQYTNLDNLFAHADEITGKVGENLRAHLDQVAINRRLVVLDSNTPVEHHLSEIPRISADNQQLKLLLERFELRRHFDLVASDTSTVQSQNSLGDLGSKGTDKKPHEVQTHQQLSCPEVTLITNKEQLATWVKAIEKAGVFALDCETTGLDYHQDKIVGIALSLPDGTSGYAPCCHNTDDEQLSATALYAGLADIFANTNIRMIGQNLKFDLHMLAQSGIYPKCRIEDTMLQSYVLNASAGRHNLTALAKRVFSYAPIEYQDVTGSGKNALTFADVPLQLAANYAGEDAWLAGKLHQAMQPQLNAIDQLDKLYRDIEIPLVSVLCDMEQNGFLLDDTLLGAYSDELTKKLQQLTYQVWQLAGEQFTLDSPKQLGHILFAKLGLPVKHKTPKGDPSTSEQVLQELASEHQLPQIMLEYRTLQKLRSTYTYPLVEQIHPQTGRVHSSFHQAITATGRLSSSNPNLQNLPIKTEEGQKIRSAFIAPAGKQIVSADYSQIELRIMAHLSQDAKLLDAFHNNQDIHSATAFEVFQAKGSKERRAAKAINFGLMYGMGAYGLARNLGISKTEATAYITRYFARYTGVYEYMQYIREQVAREGYVETIFGRRLYLPGIHSQNGIQKRAAERAAINAPMQGSAADIIKLAMIKVHQQYKDSQCKMLLQVHDELVFEVPTSQLVSIKKHIAESMQNVVSLRVPLVVEVGSGNNWLEAH